MQIISPNNFNKIIASETTLIYCWYEGCIPCKPLTGLLEELERNYSDIKFAKLNIIDYEGLKSRLDVKFTPQIVVYRDGVQLGRIVHQTKELLVKEFDSLVEHQGTDLKFELPDALKTSWL